MPTYDFQAYSTGSDAKSSAANSGAAVAPRAEESVRQHCLTRYLQMKTERESWRRHWLELADFILPRRGRMLILPNEGKRGAKVGHKILNAKATKSSHTLASGMLTGLTSPSHRWFVLGVEDEQVNEHGPVRQWLDMVTSRMLTVLARSNVYNGLHTLYEDEGTFGTGVMLVEDDLHKIARAHVMAPGEYMLANGPGMEVDTVCRDFVLTVDQMVRRWGYDKCSAAVQALYRTNQLHAEREIVHLIEPNPAYDGVDANRLPPGWSKGFIRGFPFRSVYFEIGGDGDSLLEERGYHEQPFMAPRWTAYQDDAYGRSPGMDALADVKSLQRLERDMAEGISKLVNPPLVAPQRMQHEPINAMPGGLNFLTEDAAGVFKPLYQVDFKPEMLRPLIADKERLIDAAYFADLFLMISQMEGAQPPTAEEIRVRQEEKMLQLGPVVERNQSELINPLIDRLFGIMSRRSVGRGVPMIPPPPPEIRGMRVEVTVVSPLAAAQRATSTTSIEQLMASAGRLAGNPAWEPTVSAKINPAKILDRIADALMVPVDCLNDDDEAMAQVKARAAQQQAAQQGQAAMAAVQGAQTLSQTDVGGGQNALAAILGNGPSPAPVARA